MKRYFVLFALFLLSCGAAPAEAAKRFGGVPQPQNLDLLFTSDSGFSSADNLTNDTTPTFTIGNIAAGATVELLRNDVVVLTVTGTAGSMSLTDPNAPPDAVHVYKVRQTLAPNSNTSLPLSITIDNTRPTVTINQAAGQADPATLPPLRYTAVLSDRPPDAIFTWSDEGFEEEDVSSAGSTINAGHDYVRPFICDVAGTTCDIEAIANTPGTLQLSVPEHSFTDMAGNWNLASTSTDNIIDFQPVPTTMNFLGRVRKFGPGDRVAPFPLTVKIFDTVTNEQFTVQTNSAGYFRLLNHSFYAGTARTLTVRVYNKSGQQIYFDAFVVEGDRFLIFTLPETP